MSNIFFTADTHFGHGRIIEYCSRPFSSHEEMDEAMISRFNEVIRPGDILYHLGDIAWSSWDLSQLRRLNTKAIHLILGNHDKHKLPEYQKYCQWVGEYKEIHFEKGSPSTCLFHYPMRSWHSKGKGGFALYGHCHGSLEPGLDRSMDVGVDTHNFYPYAWEEITQRLGTLPIFSPGTSKEFTTGLGAAHPNRIGDSNENT